MLCWQLPISPEKIIFPEKNSKGEKEDTELV